MESFRHCLSHRALGSQSAREVTDCGDQVVCTVCYHRLLGRQFKLSDVLPFTNVFISCRTAVHVCGLFTGKHLRCKLL